MTKIPFDFRNLSDISIDIETSGLKNNQHEIVSIAFAWCEGTQIRSCSYYLDRFFADSHLVDQNSKTVSLILEQTLFNNKFSGTVVFHNHLFDIGFLISRFKCGYTMFRSADFSRIADTLQFSRVIRNNKFQSHISPDQLSCHSLKYLAKEYLGFDAKDLVSFEQATSGKNIRLQSPEVVLKYNEQDAVLTLKLWRHFSDNVELEIQNYFFNLEMPHLLSLLALSLDGVPFDLKMAKNLYEEIAEELLKQEASIYLILRKEINLYSNDELKKSIFYNPRLKYLNPVTNRLEVLRPLFVSAEGNAQVDIETLESIKRNIGIHIQNKSTIDLLSRVIRHIELQKSSSKIESLMANAVYTKFGFRIYPKISASAISGRVTCTSPNLLGLPKKIIKNGQINQESDTSELDSKSVRSLIRVDSNYNVLSIDISGLDLGVVTDGINSIRGDSKFYWNLFMTMQHSEFIDPHFALLKKFLPNLYSEAFRPFLQLGLPDLNSYWAKKVSSEEVGGQIKKSITFIECTSGDKVKIYLSSDDQNIERKLKEVREVSKRLNLAVTYVMGASSAAVQLSKGLGKQVPAVEAQKLIDQFYSPSKGFPEIRTFQDRIANQIYRNGFCESPFGRKFYAETWDNLCHQKLNLDAYEFILKIRGEFYYIECATWLKEKDDVISDLKIIDCKFGLRFRNLKNVVKIDPFFFRPKNEFSNKALKRKTEDTFQEDSNYELNRIALTHEIDKFVVRSKGMSIDERELRLMLVSEGAFQISEKLILFYRTKNKAPSSNYFSNYKPIIKVAKKFFPAFCQGIATTVAKRCLTEIRTRLEKETRTARLLLFIHDQVDVVCSNEEVPIVQKILQESISIPLPPLSVRFSGEYKNNGQEFR